MEKKNRIVVMVKEPGENWNQWNIENRLEDFQQLVGGYRKSVPHIVKTNIMKSDTPSNFLEMLVHSEMTQMSAILISEHKLSGACEKKSVNRCKPRSSVIR